MICKFLNISSLVMTVACALPLMSQAAPEQGTPRTIDVTVVDKTGALVSRAFAKDDFVLKENGEPKDIAVFGGTGGTGSKGAVPASVTIVVDHLSGRMDPAVRPELDKFLAQLPATLDGPIQIAELSEDGLHQVAGPTKDRQVLQKGTWMREETRINEGQESYWIRTFNALVNLSMAQSGFSGRRDLIWLGFRIDGISAGTYLSKQTIVDQAKRLLNLLAEQRVTLFYVEAGAPEILARTGVEDLAQNHGFRTASPADPFSNVVSISRIAQETGGRSYFDVGGWAVEMLDALRWGTSGYSIAYEPSRPGSDGKFKRVQLTMKDPELRPQFKSGVYGIQPFLPEGVTIPTAAEAAKTAMREAATAAAPPRELTVVVKGLKRSAATGTMSFEVDLVPAELEFAAATTGSSGAGVTISAMSLGTGPALLGITTKTVEVKIADGSTRVATPALHFTLNVNPVKDAARVRFVVRDGRSGKIGTADMDAAALLAMTSN
jgi:VWFA-related protein